MLKWLRKNASDTQRARDLYAAIVAQSRNPAFYTDFQIPDTIGGRFELLTLHMFLVVRTLDGQGNQAAEIGRQACEVMFEQVDDAMRKLGVGDLKVYKRVYSAAGDFYGRVTAYEEALEDADGPEKLQAAIERNMYEDAVSPVISNALTAYVFDNLAHIAPQLETIVKSGKVSFVDVPRI